MSRKLIVLNVVLVAGVIGAGVQFRQRWKSAHERALASGPKPLPSLPKPKYSPMLPEPPVMATNYATVAQQTLFDPSRNPNVPVEVPPPPPPPPPMPPLPAYRGMMNIGEGPIAFLALGNGRNQPIHPGENIGPFKLLDVSNEEVIFEWDGKQVHQQVSKSAPQVASTGSGGGRTEAPAAAAAPPPPPLKGPGDATNDGRRTCNMNDGNAPGAVVDGFRKVVYKTPFGESCGWEK